MKLRKLRTDLIVCSKLHAVKTLKQNAYKLYDYYLRAPHPAFYRSIITGEDKLYAESAAKLTYFS